MATDIAEIPAPPQCREMIRAGALVAINSSGSKHSQCMTILLSRIVPREQLLVVHAPHREVEWPGTSEHIEATLPAGVQLILARISCGKSLLESIEERGRFPESPRGCLAGGECPAAPVRRSAKAPPSARPSSRRAGAARPPRGRHPCKGAPVLRQTAPRQHQCSTLESNGNPLNSTSRVPKTARDLTGVRAVLDGEETLLPAV